MSLSRRLRIAALWEVIRSSYWFVPGIMTLLAGGLAVATLQVDDWLAAHGEVSLPLVYAAGPDGARSVLATIAGSMITVAGVSFSVVLVALTQAASMFGPRLVPSFLRDRGNQLVLGTFVATFVYCLLLLIRVTGGEDGFVPGVGVAVAVALALASVGVLIFFLHHAAASIQVAHVVGVAGRELDHAVREAFPESAEPAADPPWPEGPTSPVVVDEPGYVHAVDHEALVELAARRDLAIDLSVPRGRFVLPGIAVAAIAPADACDREVVAAVRKAVLIGQARGGIHDVFHAVEQLAEVAVRALSPGINDPLTAVTCVDRLAGSLAELGRRADAVRWRCGDDGRPRVRLRVPTREEVVDRAYELIRLHGGRTYLVPRRQLETIGELADVIHDRGCHRALRRQADLVLAGALPHQSTDEDREALRSLHRRAVERLASVDGGTGAAPPPEA